jgi:hypothetical protein
MIGRILQWVFVPGKTRRKLAGRRAAPAAKPRAPATSERSHGAARERLMNDALQVYRAQRKEYENLDPETRRQIEADAEKAFGAVLKPEDCGSKNGGSKGGGR